MIITQAGDTVPIEPTHQLDEGAIKEIYFPLKTMTDKKEIKEYVTSIYSKEKSRRKSNDNFLLSLLNDVVSQSSSVKEEKNKK
jgi:hypothetical protein